MDYEQEYYDLLFENKKLKQQNQILEDELIVFKSKKNYLALAVTYVEKLRQLNKVLNKIYIYNQKILNNEKDLKVREKAEEIIRIMEVEK